MTRAPRWAAYLAKRRYVCKTAPVHHWKNQHRRTLTVEVSQRVGEGRPPVPVHAVVDRHVGRIDHGIRHVGADVVAARVKAPGHESAHQQGADGVLVREGGREPVRVVADPGREEPARPDDDHAGLYGVLGRHHVCDLRGFQQDLESPHHKARRTGPIVLSTSPDTPPIVYLARRSWSDSAVIADDAVFSCHRLDYCAGRARTGGGIVGDRAGFGVALRESSSARDGRHGTRSGC